jgi:hypothetical protein
VFNHDEVMALLRNIEAHANDCRPGANAPTSGSVAVTFMPTGTTNGVVIRGPLRGTETGLCLQSRFEAAQIDPYKGRAESLELELQLE